MLVGHTVNGSASRLIRLNVDGSVDPTFNTNTVATVGSAFQKILVLSDGRIYVGGSVTLFGGAPCGGLVRLNPNGSRDFSFSSPAALVVADLEMQSNGQVVVAGSFNTISGTTRSNLARLNLDGSPDTGWGAANMANNYVQALAFQADGKLLAVGGFTNVLGSGRNQVARFNSDGALDGGFNPGTGPSPANSMLTVASLANGQIMIGGTFSTYAGTNRSRVARLFSNGTIDTNFNATSVSGSSVAAITELPNTKLMVGGDFSVFPHNGQNASGIMRLLTNGAPDTSFAPGTGTSPASVQTILPLPDGRIVIGGGFTSFNGVFKSYLARLLGDGPNTPVVAISPGLASAIVGDTVLFSATATGLNPLRFQWRKDGTNIAGATNTFLSLSDVQTNAAGGYSVVLTNSSGAVTSLVAMLTVNTGGSPFDNWAASSGLTAGNNQPGQDADGDGIPKLFEYYFGSLPLNGASGLEPFGTSVTVSAQDYPAIGFIRSKTASGVTPSIRVSSSVLFADSLGSTEHSVTDQGNGTELVVIRSNVSTATQPSQFLQLRLSIPSPE